MLHSGKFYETKICTLEPFWQWPTPSAFTTEWESWLRPNFTNKTKIIGEHFTRKYHFSRSTSKFHMCYTCHFFVFICYFTYNFWVKIASKWNCFHLSLLKEMINQILDLSLAAKNDIKQIILHNMDVLNMVTMVTSQLDPNERRPSVHEFELRQQLMSQCLN